MNMTWNQFKEHVDKLLTDKSISHDEEIWYIDISFPKVYVIGKECDWTDCPCVGIEDCGITIS